MGQVVNADSPVTKDQVVLDLVAHESISGVMGVPPSKILDDYNCQPIRRGGGSPRLLIGAEDLVFGGISSLE